MTGRLQVRLDAADGTLDGFAHTAKIELNAVNEDSQQHQALRSVPRKVCRPSR